MPIVMHLSYCDKNSKNIVFKPLTLKLFHLHKRYSQASGFKNRCLILNLNPCTFMKSLNYFLKVWVFKIINCV